MAAASRSWLALWNAIAGGPSRTRNRGKEKTAQAAAPIMVQRAQSGKRMGQARQQQLLALHLQSPMHALTPHLHAPPRVGGTPALSTLHHPITFYTCMRSMPRPRSSRMS